MSAVLRRSNARTESANARLTAKAELVIATTRNMSLSLIILIISTVVVIIVEDAWGYLNATLFVIFFSIFENSITVAMFFVIRYIGKSRAIDSEALKSPSIRNRTFGGSINSVAPSVMSTNGGT